MNDTKYMIFNHAAAFGRCRLFGFEAEGGAAVLPETATSGVLFTPVMDCREQGNVWKRLFAEWQFPQGTAAVWRFYATDTEHEAQRFNGVLFGETNAPAVFERLRQFEVSQKNDANDFLLQGVKGRYCVAAVEVNKPANTPQAVIDSIQVYCAWESFTQYLPAIFRNDNDFLERFMRLFSAPYLDMEHKIDVLAEIFDPRTAPDAMLPGLAGMMGIPHIGLWQIQRLRRLLIEGLWREKGRISVLPDFIEIYCGFRPYIAENFRMTTGEPENDRHYTTTDLNIYLPPEAAAANLNISIFHTVLQGFLPCGVTYRLRILDAQTVLSDCAFLGINTRLGEYAPAKIGVNSRLNYVIL